MSVPKYPLTQQVKGYFLFACDVDIATKICYILPKFYKIDAFNKG